MVSRRASSSFVRHSDSQEKGKKDSQTISGNYSLFAQRDDPLLQHANDLPSFAWFQAFIILEVVFQLPTFFIGIRGLYKSTLLLLLQGFVSLFSFFLP